MDLSPQNETKLNQTLLFILHFTYLGGVRTHPTHPLPTGLVLDSGAVGPGFKSQPRRCQVSLRQTVHTNRASVHQAAKLVAALLRVARVTAGLAEGNGSVPPGL